MVHAHFRLYLFLTKHILHDSIILRLDGSCFYGMQAHHAIHIIGIIDNEKCSAQLLASNLELPSSLWSFFLSLSLSCPTESISMRQNTLQNILHIAVNKVLK